MSSTPADDFRRTLGVELLDGITALKEDVFR